MATSISGPPLPISSLPIPSLCRRMLNRSGIGAMGVRYGGRMRQRGGEYGIVRATRGNNDDVGVEEEEEPALLRMGVALVTETLRLVSSLGSSQSAVAAPTAEPSDAPVADANVLEALRKDYNRAYFLTGDFTGTLYSDDCLFADPTIQFRGRDKYQRNLNLLVPFFEDPQLTLFDIHEEDMKLGQERTISAKWNLRTYLRLPWKPLVDVDGSTLYVMDTNSKIVKHIESWSVSGREAVQQLFVPSDRAFFRRKP